MHKLYAAALLNNEVIQGASSHYWVFDYGLNDLELHKSLGRLTSIITGVLRAHSTEKAFSVQFRDIQALGQTNGNTITLNARLFDRLGKTDIVPIFSAVALHELFHNLYSDFNSKYLKLPPNNPKAVLWQFTEDTRIECIGKSNNFSCWEDFSLLQRKLLHTSMQSFNITQLDTPLNKVLKVMCKWVRKPDALWDEDRQVTLPDGCNLIQEIEKVIPNYAPLDKEFSTDAVIDAFSTLLEQFQEKSDTNESGDGEQNEINNSQEISDTKVDSGTGAVSDEQGTTNTGEGLRKDTSEYEIASATEEPDEGKISGQVEVVNKEFEQVIQQASSLPKGNASKQVLVAIGLVETDTEEVGKDHWTFNQLPGGCTGPTKINVSGPMPITQDVIEEYQKHYNSVKSGVKAIRSKFLIRHSEINIDTKEQLKGKLDTTRLHKVTYDRHVFKTRETIKSIGLDIALVLDQSGSMNYGNRMEQCKKCGILLASAFEGVPGLSLSIFAHTTGYEGGRTCEITNIYGGKAGKNIKNIATLYPGGGTFDGFALGYVGSTLLKSDSVNEKWLIYVSDGEPNVGFRYMGQQAIEHTGKVAKELLRKGAHVIGVDIGNQPDFVKMFPMSVKFTDVSQLVRNVSKLVTALVRSRSQEIHC